VKKEDAKGSRESDLWLGRTALARGMVTGHNLTEALLVQSGGGMRKPLDKILIERNLLTRDQIRSLRSALESRPTERHAATVATTGAEARLGTIITKVLCDSLMHVGRWRTTYVGRLPRDPEPVALQLIEKDALRHGLWMDFLEVVRGCIGIQVRNLVEVIDVKPVEEHFAIVTRFSKGGITLSDLLGRVRRLKLSEALRITKEVAQGLAVLHAAGLTHRDVKPDNVLLGRDGSVQVMNAGIVFEPPGAQRFGDRGSIFGTPHYMAPEALKGMPPDPMTDIYALGVLGYELVTGTRPFEGATIDHLREQHLESQPIAPHSVIRALPKDVGELLVWMLAKESTERPNAPKLVSTLERLSKTIQRSGHTQKFQAFDPNG
jgi:serine/threonine protein kinase